VTPEEFTQVIVELNQLDYNVQDQRNRALQILQQLTGIGEVPSEVANAAAQAWRRLEAGGGVAEQTPRDFRKRSEYLFGLFDVVPMSVALTPLDMMDTGRGKRYMEALFTAAQTGDPAALRRVTAILEEDDAVPRDTRNKIEGAIEVVIEQEDGGVPPADAARTPMGAGQEGALPPGLDFDAFAGMLQASGGVPFYGVPEQTLDDEGRVVPWAAIVGDEEVAPRYPMGWSKQPERFGLTNEESIARAQILMEEAGMLQPGQYTLGVWDPMTAGRSPLEGWQRVLSFANVTGTDWEAAFGRLYDAGVDAASRGMQLELERLARAPMFEDPERLRDRTRRFMRSMGRQESQITDEELESIMQMAVTGAQQSRMQQLTAGVERQAELGMRGDIAVGALQGGDMPVGPLVQPEMDPIAHFDSALRNVLGREIESREAQEEARVGAPRLARSAGMIGSAR
jgi:uncharacterized protein (UPF0147 family)